MPIALAIAFGGALGALGRYAVDSLIERHTESVFPWATFAVNVTGCLAVGFLIAALVDRHRAPAWLRAGLVVGFCGGYTTFSTFAQETLDLTEGRHVAVAAATVTASVALGLLAVYVGARLGGMT
ncbi:MAG TPA: fluoride efflux transporter CrcB [Gaiella sp.]|jgi:CrcB protein